MTTLELYCKETGWQGGTIYQALAFFKDTPIYRQEVILSAIQRATDKWPDVFRMAAKRAKIDRPST